MKKLALNLLNISFKKQRQIDKKRKSNFLRCLVRKLPLDLISLLSIE